MSLLRFLMADDKKGKYFPFEMVFLLASFTLCSLSAVTRVPVIRVDDIWSLNKRDTIQTSGLFASGETIHPLILENRGDFVVRLLDPLT
jgi:hypothetical protein